MGEKSTWVDTLSSRPPLRRGVPLTSGWSDPRFSQAQVKALERVANADQTACLLGLDGSYRPVVSASLGHPRQTRTFAIQRNGDPTAAGTLIEPWQS